MDNTLPEQDHIRIKSPVFPFLLSFWSGLTKQHYFFISTSETEREDDELFTVILKLQFAVLAAFHLSAPLAPPPSHPKTSFFYLSQFHDALPSHILSH